MLCNLRNPVVQYAMINCPSNSIVPPDTADYLAEAIPTAKHIETITGGGHNISFQSPNQINNAIKLFLQELPHYVSKL